MSNNILEIKNMYISEKDNDANKKLNVKESKRMSVTVFVGKGKSHKAIQITFEKEYFRLTQYQLEYLYDIIGKVLKGESGYRATD